MPINERFDSTSRSSFDPTDERQRRKDKDGTYMIHTDDDGKELEFDETYREGQFKGVKRYVPEAGFVDNPGQFGKIRKLSVTVTLSDPKDYKGGELEFDFRNLDPDKKRNVKKCTEILPKGSLVVFPSFVWHRVCPVKSGERNSLVIWNLGYPFQ